MEWFRVPVLVQGLPVGQFLIQSDYCFHRWKQWKVEFKPVVVHVPSGFESVNVLSGFETVNVPPGFKSEDSAALSAELSTWERRVTIIMPQQWLSTPRSAPQVAAPLLSGRCDHCCTRGEQHLCACRLSRIPLDNPAARARRQGWRAGRDQNEKSPLLARCAASFLGHGWQ